MYFLQNQYKFVFETLLEYTRGIDSRFPVSELANKIKERGVKDKKTKKNVYQMEFEVRSISCQCLRVMPLILDAKHVQTC